ncbi:MAG: 16S rRNA (cytidine(1402)-2'-O)-methyltransferase [Rhabdaerophilum sp.]|jgi:16S rRNA (cytidine1402-2'-O)-methyltransferase|nr:16S rRNA (cytidine(1402)-2'-O)-methyltransferase [Methylobacterium sp.]
MAHYLLRGERFEAGPVEPGLHLVATPIGNLRDITLRALDTLAGADLVLAEDTRVTKGLLTHFGITTHLHAYHEHNAAREEAGLLARLKGGETLALVSDAGTPIISDPGQRLARAALAEGVKVTTEPGASAVLTALVLAGLPAERFFFEGFLPAKAGERRRRIQEISGIPGTLVLFEAPHRVAETMADLASLLGKREAALARELTKKFETVRRGTLPDLAAALAVEGPPRGEIVLVIGPPEAEGPASEDRIDAALRAALERHSQRDAAEIVAGELGLKRREVYARALRLSEKD